MNESLQISKWVIVPMVILTLQICKILQTVSMRIVVRKQLLDVRDSVRDSVRRGEKDKQAAEMMERFIHYVYDDVILQPYIAHVHEWWRSRTSQPDMYKEEHCLDHFYFEICEVNRIVNRFYKLTSFTYWLTRLYWSFKGGMPQRYTAWLLFLAKHGHDQVR